MPPTPSNSPGATPVGGPPRSGTPDAFPPVENVFTKCGGIRKLVPPGARDAWAQCLVIALRQVATQGTSDDWKALLTLPASILAVTTRGGKRGKQQAAAQIRQRCQSWLEGHGPALWQATRVPAAVRAVSHKSSSQEEEDRWEMARTAVQEGKLAKGCAALSGCPPVEPDHKSATAMREKHPPMSAAAQARLDALPRASPASSLELEWDDIQKALKGFPTASAGGCTGLRPSHLQSALIPAWQTDLVRQSTEVGNLMLKGYIPEDIRPYICGAKLAALPKPSGGSATHSGGGNPPPSCLQGGSGTAREPVPGQPRANPIGCGLEGRVRDHRTLRSGLVRQMQRRTIVPQGQGAVEA